MQNAHLLRTKCHHFPAHCVVRIPYVRPASSQTGNLLYCSQNLAHRAQYPLIKEYTLNDIEMPRQTTVYVFIKGILTNNSGRFSGFRLW